MDVADVAAGANHAVLDGEALGKEKRFANPIADPVAVVGMDPIQKALEADLRLSRRHAQNPKYLVGPVHLVGLGVPLPASDPGNPLSVRE